MKKSITDLLNSCRNYFHAEPEPEPSGVTAQILEIQKRTLAYVKQNHGEEFREELSYVKRNREFIASEAVVERLREKARCKEGEIWEARGGEANSALQERQRQRTEQLIEMGRSYSISKPSLERDGLDVDRD